jgi:nitrate/nitrite-specific signal transduction histidine kinase
MSWITVIWSMNAGACLTLAVFYGAVWCKQRENKQAELLAQQQHGELEAVRNAVEHGAARKVLIQLTFGHRDMLLTVQDEGAGFDTKTNAHGMGLRIMRYRAQCIGSSCEVHTGATKGITVYCRAPLEAQPSLSTIS